jgi:hypothetical protein
MLRQTHDELKVIFRPALNWWACSFGKESASSKITSWSGKRHYPERQMIPPNIPVGVVCKSGFSQAGFNSRQSDQGQEQDFSAVILQMEKQAQLDVRDERQIRVGVPSTKG